MGVECGLRQLQGKGRGLGVELPSEHSLDVWKAGPGVMLPPKQSEGKTLSFVGHLIEWGKASSRIKDALVFTNDIYR